MTDELKECRRGFETWALSEEYSIEPYSYTNEVYFSSTTERLYEGWKACWQSRTKPEGVDIEAGAKAIASDAMGNTAIGVNIIPNKSDYAAAKACAAAWHLTAKE